MSMLIENGRDYRARLNKPGDTREIRSLLRQRNDLVRRLHALALEMPGDDGIDCTYGRGFETITYGSIDSPNYDEHPEKALLERRIDVLDDEIEGLREDITQNGRIAARTGEAPDDRQAKAASSVAVVKLERRFTRAELNKQHKLLILDKGIKDAIARGDLAAAGAKLREAKDRVLDHGEFGEWLRKIGIDPRNAQNYMAKAGV